MQLNSFASKHSRVSYSNNRQGISYKVPTLQPLLDGALFKIGETVIWPNDSAFCTNWRSSLFRDQTGNPIKLPKFTKFLENVGGIEGLHIGESDLGGVTNKPIAMVFAGAGRTPLGTREDVSNREQIALLHSLGFEIMVVYLPGFGKESTGHVNDKTFARVAKELNDYTKAKGLVDQTSLFGFSTSNNMVLRMLEDKEATYKNAYLLGAFTDMAASMRSYGLNMPGLSLMDRIQPVLVSNLLRLSGHHFNNRQASLNVMSDTPISLLTMKDDPVTTPKMAETLLRILNRKGESSSLEVFDWQNKLTPDLEKLYRKFLARLSQIDPKVKAMSEEEVLGSSFRKPHLNTPHSTVFQHQEKISEENNLHKMVHVTL